MNRDQLYQDLKAAAEKLDISVAEKSFKNVGFKVKSGLCTVRGKKIYVIDKNKSLNEKIELLGGCLARMPHERIYLVPFVREVLEAIKSQKR